MGWLQECSSGRWQSVFHDISITRFRRQFEKEFASNPRLNVEAVRTLLGASGQRPSEAKVQQVYRQIVNQQKSAMAKNKKK